MSRAAAKKAPVVTVGGLSARALKQLGELLLGIAPRTLAEPVAGERFTKVSANGALLPKSAKDWEGVYEPATGLVWGRRLLPGAADWKGSLAKANAATLCGEPARAPTVRERFCLSDFTRLDPALDVNYFDASETSAWEWTSTEAAPSGYAWFVSLGNGLSLRDDQGCHYRVRAVRAGQFSAIGSAAASKA